MISVTIFSLGGIIYFYFIKGATLQTRFGLSEAAVDINHIGFFSIPAIFIIIVFLTREKNLHQKLFLLVSLMLAGTVTALSQTTGALVGILIPIPFLFIRNKRFVILAVASMIFLIVVTPFSDQLRINALRDKVHFNLELGRLPIWYTHFQSIKEHPITGTGFGMLIYNEDFFIKNNLKLPPKYQVIVEATQGNLPYMPHNAVIDLTVRTGFFGSGLFLYCLYVFFRLGWLLYKNAKDVFVQNWNLCLMACCLSLLVQGMFVDLMIGSHVVYLFIFFAMISILWQIEESNKNFSEQLEANTCVQRVGCC
ncbi:MAG: O-antigen ligase family protein [Bacillota bacterium]|nr:O-antigen ligase family protein [Bacillota bacterium]